MAQLTVADKIVTGVAGRLIEERPEAVNLDGVKLFIHAFSAGMAAAPFRSSRFTIQPGCGTREDRHAVQEIWFVSKGRLNVSYDGSWHLLAAGQAIYFESWKPHFATNVDAVEAEIFSVWWD